MVHLGETVYERRRGFTLIEMMIVVAVIAILAAVVVPTFFRESAKTRSGSEVTPMFTEMANKLEQYKSDNSKYTNATTLVAGTPSTCPSSPSHTGVDAVTTCAGTGTAWVDLRVAPTAAKLHCSYEIQVGDAGDDYVGTLPSPISFTAPATTGWWTLLATCDADNNSSVNSTYFMTSVDATIQKANDGR